MKFIDLFAGIGGFRYGLQKAAEQTNYSVECVWSNDCDPYVATIYTKNFCKGFNRNKDKRGKGNQKKVTTRNGERLVTKAQQETCPSKRQSGQYSDCIAEQGTSHCIDSRDIREVESSDIPDHDLLVAGFPCQAFSIAGKRLGFEDTRGTLFFEIARILRDKRPRYFLLENVKGLLSHDNGKTFQTILGILTDLGYEYQWQVLNSKNFGVPQNRERVFIVGYFGRQPRSKIFPFAENGRKDAFANPTVRTPKNSITSTITIHYTKNQHGSQYVAEEHKKDRYILHNIYGGFKEDKPREFRDYSPTIRTPKGGGHIPNVVEGISIRRLTPVECERLQGFPDGWTEGVSDTQRYKLLGNAVTTTVVTEIGKRIIKVMNKYERRQSQYEARTKRTSAKES